MMTAPFNNIAKIAARIDSYRNDMIRLQFELTAIPAISPESGGDGEQKRSDFLVRYLEEVGFSAVHLCPAPDARVSSGFRPNIVATLPGKREEAVWIITHMDIVPPGEPGLWSSDPYKAYVKDGFIFGRGTEDNQQDLVASIFAARSFLDEGVMPEHTIRLAIVADEETGSLYGLDYLLKKDHSLFGRSDFYVIPDFGSDTGDKIEIAEKSILWMRFKTVGKQCHASRPQAGRNAFRAASFLVTRLEDLHRRFSATNTLFQPPESTFEPTRKDRNVENINTIPGEDVFFMDCRVLPDYPLPEVVAEMRKMADEIERDFGVTVELTPAQTSQAPPPTSESAPVISSLRRAIRRVYGVDPKPVGIGGGTVAACLRSRGLSAAVWSRLGETAHQPDEHCLIENMVGNAKVYAFLFCGVPETSLGKDRD